jgi:hypothetical protein
VTACAPQLSLIDLLADLLGVFAAVIEGLKELQNEREEADAETGKTISCTL